MVNRDKKVIGIIVGVLSLVAIIFIVFMLKDNSKSIDIELNTNYKSLVGIKVESDIILVIDDKDNVSNILFLNEKSVSTFANKKIEGKNLEKAMELLVDKLKNSKEFNKGDNLYITNYDKEDTYSKVFTELNKEFVIYGVNNKIVTNSGSLSDKKKELKINDQKEDINSLYEYSKKMLKK